MQKKVFLFFSDVMQKTIDKIVFRSFFFIDETLKNNIVS